MKNMLYKLFLIMLNLVAFMLIHYFVELEKNQDKVCNEIVKDYNWDLDRHFNDLKEASKRTEIASENANRIRPIIEKLLLVKNKEEADSVSLIAEEMLNKLGWDFYLKYENHKELGVCIIDQFIDKFNVFDGNEYDNKLNIVITELNSVGDSIHVKLEPIFLNPNYTSIMVNGLHEIHENPFNYNEPVKFVLMNIRNGDIRKYSVKNKNDNE